MRLYSKASNKNALFEIEVPRGSREGTEIKPSSNICDLLGYDPGSIKFVIKEVPHKRFVRNIDDLIYTLKISYIDILIKTPVNIVTIDGRKIKHIPNILSSDSTFRIKNEGMPKYLSNEKGDLLIKYQITFPEVITDQQKAKIEELKNI